jgi:hypothetical protein
MTFKIALVLPVGALLDELTTTREADQLGQGQRVTPTDLRGSSIMR